MRHLCHATNCKSKVPPEMFMCKRHWYMLPAYMRNAIWANYVPGQEITKTPTSEYLEAARKAIEYVEKQEAV